MIAKSGWMVFVIFAFLDKKPVIVGFGKIFFVLVNGNLGRCTPKKKGRGIMGKLKLTAD